MAGGPNPSGLCMCGCGEQTRLASATNKRTGAVCGQPLSYVDSGHVRRRGPVDFIVDENGCWVWQRGKNKGGYGLITRERKQWTAHRWHYVQAKGPIPDGLEIDHLCRNRACVNPDHLEAVTRAENVRRGSKTKLSLEDVRAIRAARDEVQRELGEKYGVVQSVVSRIQTGALWREAA